MRGIGVALVALAVAGCSTTSLTDRATGLAHNDGRSNAAPYVAALTSLEARCSQSAATVAKDVESDAGFMSGSGVPVSDLQFMRLLLRATSAGVAGQNCQRVGLEVVAASGAE